MGVEVDSLPREAFFAQAKRGRKVERVPSLSAGPIIAGIIDEQHDFQYHVSIHRMKLEMLEYEYFCGGTIIHKKFILTVGHCFIHTDENRAINDPFDIAQRQPKIIAGTNQRDGPGTERDIVKIFIPIIYQSRPDLQNDIAVAQLSENLDVRHNRNLMKVSIGVLPLNEHEDDIEAKFCGFGAYEFKMRPNGSLLASRHLSEINRFLPVSVLYRNHFAEMHSKIYAIRTDRTQLQTACYGDSGSGLIVQGKVVGVLSSGPAGCDTDIRIPIKFTRISAFRRYVDSAMAEHGDHSELHVFERELSPRPSSVYEYGEGSSRPGTPYPSFKPKQSFNFSQIFGKGKKSTR